MAVSTSPVTPSVLRWAVQEDGRPVADIADALKVGQNALDGWMSGNLLPTRGQVSDLAKVLQRPRALFFLPQPPGLGTLPASFRHPPGARHDVSIATRRAVRQARRLQHAVAWTAHDSPPVDVPSRPLNSSPVEAAAVTREWLGLSTSEQAAWRDDYEALRAWRAAIDARGVLVFALEIGRDEVRGFSAWHANAPLIVANVSGVAPAARIFTVAHELGHLVTRRDAACVELPLEELASIDVERWCERFGAALLMPEAAVKDLTASREITTGGAGIVDVREMTLQFRVSARAAALRLIDLGLASQSLYAEVLRVFVPKPRTDSRLFSPPRVTARLRQYGPRVIGTVLENLPPRDALSVLRIDVEDARRLAEEVPGVPVP